MTRTILLSVAAASLLVAAGFGCGDDEGERRPNQMLAGWQGPPPRMNIVVTGPDADEGKRERCGIMAREAGILVDPSAPVQGVLTLSGNNHLQIMAGGAIVSDNQKPGWDMEHLCNDAITQILSVIRQNPQAAAPPQYGYAQPGYQQAPPPMAGPMMITIIVMGPEADDGKRERCNRVAMQNGGTTDPNAAVRAILTLQDGGNSLQVVSARRGVVLNQPKPGWGMEQLCQDAYQTALGVLQQEMSGPPPGYQPPPPGYQQPGYGQQQSPPQGAPAGTVAVSPMQPSANAPKNCVELGKRGLAEFGKREYASALAAFEEAIKSGNDTAMIFNKGLCLYMLHRPQEALTALQLYVDRSPKADNRNQADALIADLHRQLGND